MSMLELSTDLLDLCANDPKGPVAIHLREELLPVEGRGAPFYPPTFAGDDKYNIDELADGTKVALVDSVGSQANRMEPLFLSDEYRHLVPQINISYGDSGKGTDGVVSLLEAGHRLGDAVVRCTELADEAHQAFVALKRGDAIPMARLAPTSLIFGAWDSRDTFVKVPRILQSVIRAWSVSRLSRSAQFVPALEYSKLGIMEDEDKLKKEQKAVLSERGFVHVPSTGDPGGVIADGPIRRDVTLNLVALRRLAGVPTAELRRYALGLALVAAVEPQDPFLRQGCLLVRDADAPPVWNLVDREGERTALEIDPNVVRRFAEEAARKFGVAEERRIAFNPKLAQADVTKGKRQ
jgi:CRISPR-associated protein Csb1